MIKVFLYDAQQILRGDRVKASSTIKHFKLINRGVFRD